MDERQRGDQVAQPAGRVLRGLRAVRPGQVEVRDRLVTRWPGVDLRGQVTDQRAPGVGELGDGADGADQVRRPVVQAVVGGGERPAVHGGVAQVVQLVLQVVPADQHLQHRLGLGDATFQPLGQEPDDLLRDRGQRLDPLGVPRRVRVQRERGQLVADPGQHLGPGLVHQRLVEPAEPDAAGQVADHREAQLGGQHQVVEYRVHLLDQWRLRPRLHHPALQQRGDQQYVGRGALLGQEDPEHRVDQLVAAVQVGDTVVAEHPGQPVGERVRQPGAVDVEGLQVGVEVLPRAVHPQLGAELLAGGPVSAQVGEVGEQPQQTDLLRDRRRRQLGPRLQIPGQRAALVPRVEVEPEQHAAQVVLSAGGPLGRGRLAVRLRQVEVDALRRLRRGLVGVVIYRFQPDQRCTGLDLAAGGDRQLAHDRPERREQHGLHLHALQHQDRRARLHLGTGLRPGSPPPAPAPARAARRPRPG